MHNFKVISSLIKPVSSDCNLNCTYCFYSGKGHSIYSKDKIHRMSKKVFERFITQFALLNEKKKILNFAWQGGEPILMGLPFFEYTIEKQMNYINKGYTISNSIQTNGYLIDEKWAKFFKQNNFLVGISLDGTSDIHNIYRKNWKEKGSYDKVMETIKILSKYNVDFNILTVINNINVEKAEDLYNFLYNQGFYYQQFIPCVERNSDGNIENFSITPSKYGNFLCKLFDVWMKKGYPEVYIRGFENLLQKHTGIEPFDCTSQKKCGGYFVLEYNGDIYPCDFFVENEWKLGNIIKTDIKEIVKTDKAKEFEQLKSKGNPECNNCKWYYICLRGCPKYWFDENGRKRDYSYFCNAHKMFYEHSYLRCKKIADDFKFGVNSGDGSLNY